MAVLPANAHNVVGSVFVDGDRLEGAFGFSNGDLAPADAPVELLSPDGDVVASTVTDAQGEFVFRVTEALAYRIVADLGQGHLGTVQVFPEDIVLPASSEAAEPITESVPEPVTAAASAVDKAGSSYVLIDPAALDDAVKRAVAAQVKPLHRELVAIFGLCGAAALWLARRPQAGNR